MLARERDLTVPTGDPAARGPEWAELLDALAGATPLAAADGKSIELLPLVRDLIDLEEGSIAPVAWWQRLLGGGGGGAAPADAPKSPAGPAAEALRWPRVAARPRPPADGAHQRRADRGRDARVGGAAAGDRPRDLAGLGRRRVNRDAWAVAYDVLAPATQEAADRQLGLLYGTGY